MAKVYESGSGEASAIREELLREKEQDIARKAMADRIVTFGAIGIAALAIVVNSVKCVTMVSQKSEFAAKQAAAEKEYAALEEKVQDPDSQNIRYEDPAVGNMGEKGKDIADLQNQLIMASQGMHSAGTQFSSGALTLDPEDVAPSGAEFPDGSLVDGDAATVPGMDGLQYTPITDFDTMPGMSDYGTGDYDTGYSTDWEDPYGTGADGLSYTDTVDTSDYAALVSSFQTAYPEAFRSGVDGSALWSSYGVWEFNGLYDFSKNETASASSGSKTKLGINGVWMCYEAYDMDHARPIAVVTAPYVSAVQEEDSRFGKPTVTYTQYYIGTAGSSDTVYPWDSSGSGNSNPDAGLSGSIDWSDFYADQGSGNSTVGGENPYDVQVNPEVGSDDGSPSNRDSAFPGDTDDYVYEEEDYGGAVTIEDGDTDDTGSSLREKPSGSSGSSGSNVQPSNPNGSTSWKPGSGGSSGTEGSWNPDGNAPGTWNEGGSSIPGAWNPDGAAAQPPASSAQASPQPGAWNPAY